MSDSNIFYNIEIKLNKVIKHFIQSQLKYYHGMESTCV